MSSCNVQNSPQGFPKNCSKASPISEFHSKQTTTVCVNQFYLSLWVTMAAGMIDYGIHIALMGSSFMSQITTSLNKLVPMLRIEQIKGASCPLTKGIMLDYEGWCLSSCRSSVAEHWQLKPRVWFRVTASFSLSPNFSSRNLSHLQMRQCCSKQLPML